MIVELLCSLMMYNLIESSRMLSKSSTKLIDFLLSEVMQATQRWESFPKALSSPKITLIKSHI
jgi:hypothetical protein